MSSLPFRNRLSLQWLDSFLQRGRVEEGILKNTRKDESSRVMDVFIPLLFMMFSAVCTYVNACQVERLKNMQFILSQLCVNKTVILKNGTKHVINSFLLKVKIEFDQNFCVCAILVRFLLSVSMAF